MYPLYSLRLPQWKLRHIGIPRLIVWIWITFIAFFFISIICDIIFGWQPIAALSALFGVAFFGTVGTITTVLDGPLLGAAFLFFAICTILNMKWLGTVLPAVDFPDITSATQRRATGAFLALVVEVNTEPAPPGQWEIHQLDYGSLETRSVSAFRHSVYQDFRIHKLIVNWLQRAS